jgi:hypothetical protein
MKRNPSRSGTRSLADELAELRRLDLTALKQRWRVLYRTEAPAHIGRHDAVDGPAEPGLSTSGIGERPDRSIEFS